MVDILSNGQWLQLFFLPRIPFSEHSQNTYWITPTPKRIFMNSITRKHQAFRNKLQISNTNQYGLPFWHTRRHRIWKLPRMTYQRDSKYNDECIMLLFWQKNRTFRYIKTKYIITPYLETERITLLRCKLYNNMRIFRNSCWRNRFSQ